MLSKKVAFLQSLFRVELHFNISNARAIEIKIMIFLLLLLEWVGTLLKINKSSKTDILTVPGNSEQIVLLMSCIQKS